MSTQDKTESPVRMTDEAMRAYIDDLKADAEALREGNIRLRALLKRLGRVLRLSHGQWEIHHDTGRVSIPGDLWEEIRQIEQDSRNGSCLPEPWYTQADLEDMSKEATERLEARLAWGSMNGLESMERPTKND